ncbi:hypothetical protein HXX76_000494 [Chlamydomonas incerta]|uniref:Myb-like domain-containing protein n=1 Tax=Chlamydomonas incerta TaxID=51695 RepID=A0A835WEY8_CHLIN|nr:hypothetical protein HXX76_000494 [Chlamydomonas incerta]|eukprot:KAG2445890.1 hypothetical protein HXX76_000494 [Chlamydomonas incerta]
MWSRGTQNASPSGLWTASPASPQFSYPPPEAGASIVSAELSLDALRRKCLRRPPWSLSEEITFVHQHAVLGNAWARLATHLPQRDSSEVKNIFYSTTRSKGDNNRRVLSAYARAVQGREDQSAARVAALAAALSEMPASVAAAQAAGQEGWEEAACAAEDAAQQLRQLQQAAADPGPDQQTAEKQQAAVSAAGSPTTARAVPAQPSVREGSPCRPAQPPRKPSPQLPARSAAVQAPAATGTTQQEQTWPRSPAAVRPPNSSCNANATVAALGPTAVGRLGRDNNSHTASTAASGTGEPGCDDGPNSNDSSANNLSLIAVNSSLGMPFTLPQRVPGSMGGTEVVVRSGNTRGAAASAEHGLLLLLAAAEGTASPAADPAAVLANANAGLDCGRRASLAVTQAPSSSGGDGSGGGVGRLAQRLQQVEEAVFGAVGPAAFASERAVAATDGRREREWDELAAVKRRRVASSDGTCAPPFAAAGTGSGAALRDARTAGTHVSGSGLSSDATATDVSAIASRLRQLTAGDGVAAARLLLQQLLQQSHGSAATAVGSSCIGGRSGGDNEADWLLASGARSVAGAAAPSWWQPQQPSSSDLRDGGDRGLSLSGCGGTGIGHQETSSAAAAAEPLLPLRWVSRTSGLGAGGSGGSAATGLPPGGGRFAPAGFVRPPVAAAAVAGEPRGWQGPQRLDVHSSYAAERQQVTQAAAAAAAAAMLARYGRASAPAYECKQ